MKSSVTFSQCDSMKKDNTARSSKVTMTQHISVSAVQGTSVLATMPMSKAVCFDTIQDARVLATGSTKDHSSNFVPLVLPQGSFNVVDMGTGKFPVDAVQSLPVHNVQLQVNPVQNVQIDVAQSAQADAGQSVSMTPLQSIAVQSVPVDTAHNVDVDRVESVHVIPVQSVPVNSVQNIPLQGGPVNTMQSIPVETLQSVPLPVYSVPLQSMPQTVNPLQSIIVQSVQMESTPKPMSTVQSSSLRSVQSEPKQGATDDCFDNLDESDEVNLVVRATYWWCKDCNVKQRFECGETIEEHLRLKHRINNKAQEVKDSRVCETDHYVCLTEPHTPAPPQKIPVSGLISSVCSIPPDSLITEDQTLDTVLLLDSNTTLQVHPKPPEDKLSCHSRSLEAPQKDKTEIYLTPVKPKVTNTCKESLMNRSLLTSQKTSDALPHPKLIPVIPALSAESTASASFLHQGQVKLKTVDLEAIQPVLNQVQSTAQPSGSDQSHSDLKQQETSVAKAATPKNGASSCKDKIVPTAKTRKSRDLNPGLRSSEIDTRDRTNRETSKKTGKNLDRANIETDNVSIKRLSTREGSRLSTKRLSSFGARGQQNMIQSRPRRQSLGKITDGVAKQSSSSGIFSVTTRSMTQSGSRLLSTTTNHQPDFTSPLVKRTCKPHVRANNNSHTLTKKQRAGFKTKLDKQCTVDVKCILETDPKQGHGTNNQTKLDTHSSSGRRIRKPVRYLNGSAEKYDEDSEEETSNEVKAIPYIQIPEQGPLDIEIVPKTRKRKVAPESSVNAEKSPKDEAEISVPKPPNKKVKKENYACKDCGRKFQFEKKFNKHIKLYKNQTMQQCSKCDVKLHNLDLLNVHLYHVHKTNEPTSCLTCGKTIGSKRKLLRHILTHPTSCGQTAANLVQDSCPTVMCAVCHETVVEGEGRVERHYHTHRKQSDFTCRKCGHSFRHKLHLYNHLREHGDCDKVLLSNASQNLTQKSSLESTTNPTITMTATSDGDGHDEIHSQVQNNTHGLEPQPVHTIIAQSVEQILKFEENSLVDNSPSQITVTFIKQPEAPPFLKQKNSSTVSCQQCGKQLRTKKLLYQHLRSHGETNTVVSESGVCDDSSGVEGGKEGVSQPIDLNRGVPFGLACSVMKIDIQTEDMLRTSATSSDGTMPPRLTCSLCEQHFELESHAQRHVKRFSEQHTMVQCDQCQLKFHNFDLFNVHYTYIHQQEGSATCLTCSCQFPSKAQLLTHLGSSPGPHPLSEGFGLKTFLQEVFGKVICSTCGKSMWNYPLNIANHTRTHKSYPCPMCQHGFPYKYCLMLHLQLHSNSRNLASTQPNADTERRQVMDRLHNIVDEVEREDFVESDEVKYHCMLCEGEVTHRRKNIHKHLDLHARKILTDLRKGRYFCPDCGEDIAVAEQGLDSHIIAHHSQSPVQFVCMFCNQTFETFDLFREHEVKKHWLSVALEKRVCEVCGKELVSRQDLEKHILLHGETQGLFHCPHCKQTFRFQSKLQDHLAKHDSGSHSYACQFCGKLYMTPISLHRHEQVDHIGIKDFKHKCKHCDAQFINATHLRDHVTNKHSGGTSYTCNVCGQGFKHLSTCVRHKRVAHGGDTPYVCQECGEKFPLKRLLQQHMVSHTGVNPLQCPTCLKTFSMERTMQEHIDFVHRGIIKFQCADCGNKFPRKRNLVRHMSTCRKTSR